MANKSGLNFHFHLWMDDGQKIDVQSKPIDVIRWEAKHDKKFQDGIGSGQMMVWIAFAAARRQKLTDESTFDAFAARVEDWDVITDDDAEPSSDPTPADFPTEASESSLSA